MIRNCDCPDICSFQELGAYNSLCDMSKNRNKLSVVDLTCYTSTICNCNWKTCSCRAAANFLLHGWVETPLSSEPPRCHNSPTLRGCPCSRDSLRSQCWPSHKTRAKFEAKMYNRGKSSCWQPKRRRTTQEKRAASTVCEKLQAAELNWANATMNEVLITRHRNNQIQLRCSQNLNWTISPQLHRSQMAPA